MKNNIELSYSKERKLQTWAQGLAVHASALWDGFVFGRESDDLFRIWGQGGIELHFQMAELAITDVRLCDALFTASDSSFPGVYIYEVTEALGQIVAAHLVSTGDFPTEQEWQTALGELALSFFERGHFSDDEVATLRKVVARQLAYWQAASNENPSPPSTVHIPISPPPAGGSHSARA